MTTPPQAPAGPGALSSPCTGLCALDGEGFCRGCFRHIEEIATWSGAGDDERRAILARCAARRAARA
ncbi:DUF1289 domain-containing protein [Roseomonas sp. GCM10028921]